MSGDRRWACILGQPVRHSLSPALHNAAFAAVGLDARYLLREASPAELPLAVAALRDPACLGANVTAPHKEAVIAHVDELSAAARMLGAVNTVVSKAGRLAGHNTDAGGLVRWMDEAEIALAGGDALVLGAGGAARGAALALAQRGAACVRIANRTPARAAALAADLQSHVGDTRLEACDLAEARCPTTRPVAMVVNATSLSHEGGDPGVHATWYRAGATVALDLAYNPPDTLFLQAARAAGARTKNGLGMLVHQAVLSFACWTGIEPPVDIYYAAAAAALGLPAGASPGSTSAPSVPEPAALPGGAQARVQAS